MPLVAFYDQPIEAFYGPPQSVAVHHFADRGERVGYFFETAPIHPMLAALAFPGFGDAHRQIVERLPYAQATIALLIDGHHDDEGGTRRRRAATAASSSATRCTAPLREAAVDALADMARLQLAAGAREVMTLHETPLVIRSEADIARHRRRAVRPQPPHAVLGAPDGRRAMGEDPRRSVVDSRGRHHELENLWITDGSVFPTSLGVNPQLSVYAHARLFATEIAKAG